MPRGEGPLGTIISLGVGLAAEAIQHRRERKKSHEATAQNTAEELAISPTPCTQDARSIDTRSPSRDSQRYAEPADTSAVGESSQSALKQGHEYPDEKKGVKDMYDGETFDEIGNERRLH